MVTGSGSPRLLIAHRHSDRKIRPPTFSLVPAPLLIPDCPRHPVDDKRLTKDVGGVPRSVAQVAPELLHNDAHRPGSGRRSYVKAKQVRSVARSRLMVRKIERAR